LGWESYDFGGPQVSKNNKFVNFTSTAFRKAGAIGSHANLPFVMSTLNKIMGSTLVNSNPYTAVYTETSDHKYNWVGLDVDGSTTQVESPIQYFSIERFLEVDGSLPTIPFW
jgi:hypothetical protein